MPPQTETLEITLPIELIQRIRARVSSGKYSSVNEVVTHDLLEANEWSDLPDEPFGPPLEEWIAAEMPERLRRLHSGEEQTFTLDEVRERFAQRRAQFLADQ